MPLNKIISNLISLALTVGFIALVIFLIPSLLILLGVLFLLSIIAAIVMRFVVGKDNLKMNFIYLKRGAYSQAQRNEEIHEMKDVTDSSKKAEKDLS